MDEQFEDADGPLGSLLTAAFGAREERVEARAQRVAAYLHLRQRVESTSVAFGATTAPGDHELPDAVDRRYEFVDQLGRGGLGIVLRSRDQYLRRDVAFKVLRARLASRNDLIERFLLEAQLGAQLQHPGIASVYDLGVTQDGRPFFTMKLVEGSTLAELLELGEMSTVELIGVFSQICKAVGYAHARGVVHRDLKPSNVMVGEFGEVQVVDWGLAKVVGGEERPSADTTPVQAGVTSSLDSVPGTKLGTPGYMSPEQTRGEPVGPPADVYALGVVLCEILAERRVVHLVERAGEIDRDRIHELLAGRDPDLQKLVLECLAPAAEDRPTNAIEVGRRIDAHQRGREERVRQAELRAAGEGARAAEATQRLRAERHARRATMLLAAGILLVALGGAVAWNVVQNRAARRLESAGRAVAEELDSALRLHGEAQAATGFDGERWAHAEGAASRALSIAQLQAPGSELESRAESTLARIRAETLQARRVSDEQLERQRLDERLAELEESAMTLTVLPEALFAAFRAEYRAVGVDFEESVEAVAEQLRMQEDHPTLIAGLDALWSCLQQFNRNYVRYPDLEVDDSTSDDRVRAAKWKEYCRIALLADDATAMIRLRQLAIAESKSDLEEHLATLDLSALNPREAQMAAQLAYTIDLDDVALGIREKALLRHPSSFELQYAQASHYSELGKSENALPHIWSALAIRPDAAGAWGQLGTASRLIGRLDRATEAYRKGATLWPENLRLQMLHADAELTQGNWDELDAVLDLLEHDSPGFPFVHLLRARAAVLRLQPGAAGPHLDRAIATAPVARDERLLLADLLTAVGRGQEASGIYTRLIEEFPEFAAPYDHLGKLLYHSLHRPAEALDYLRRGQSIGSTQRGGIYDSTSEIKAIESTLEAQALLGSDDFEHATVHIPRLILGRAAVARNEPARAIKFYRDSEDKGIVSSTDTLWALDAALELANPWISDVPALDADALLIEAGKQLERFVRNAAANLDRPNSATLTDGRIGTTYKQRFHTCRLLASPLITRARSEGFAPSISAEVREAWTRAWEQVAKLEEIAAR
jgi:tRNA A-37 threonylcarbamoyl transferase component Bud32